jgi:hypothetical protein
VRDGGFEKKKDKSLELAENGHTSFELGEGVGGVKVHYNNEGTLPFWRMREGSGDISHA